MPETTPLIKAALNLRVGAGFDVYKFSCDTGKKKFCQSASESVLYKSGRRKRKLSGTLRLFYLSDDDQLY